MKPTSAAASAAAVPRHEKKSNDTRRRPRRKGANIVSTATTLLAAIALAVGAQLLLVCGRGILLVEALSLSEHHHQKQNVKNNINHNHNHVDQSDANVKLPNNTDENNNHSNIRLNKVFRDTHSRRSADALIAGGRVRVNGRVVHDMGRRVVPHTDAVELDGRLYADWEVRHGFGTAAVAAAAATAAAGTAVVEAPPGDESSSLRGGGGAAAAAVGPPEVYIKFWKPVGVTSTTDRSVPGNLIDAVNEKWNRPRHDTNDNENDDDSEERITQRIFSVGRLDKDSSGLLLLTSDGRLPNAVLRREQHRSKTYAVTLDRAVRPVHVDRLRSGQLVITTDTVRQGRHRAHTAPARPCGVEVVAASADTGSDGGGISADGHRRTLRMTLHEGRNRQIRVMLRTVGNYTVTRLHRIDFMGIALDGLAGPGDWKRLNPAEMRIIDQAIRQHQQQQQQAAMAATEQPAQ